MIKNLEERENEDTKRRVENILDYLHLRDMTVGNAERKESKKLEIRHSGSYTRARDGQNTNYVC